MIYVYIATPKRTRQMWLHMDAALLAVFERAGWHVIDVVKE